MSEEHRLHPHWLDHPGLRRLTEALRRAGHDVWFVGGAVRDAALGRETARPDIDMTTDARPEEVMAVARQTGFKVVPTGIEHGTVTVIAGDLPVEITTLRQDVETDGRHAKVVFGTSLEDDARRRDFTINALYLTPEGRLVDPVGGLADIAARRIRFIGDPRRRIREDYLRILRLFRMFAHFGDPERGLDAAALRAAAELADGLARISPERIGQEMRKLLAAPDPVPAVRAMKEAGILERILPGASAERLARLVAIEKILGIAPDPVRRLAALGGDDPVRRLRLSRREARSLARMAEGAASGLSAAALGYRLGEADGLCALLLRHACDGSVPCREALAALRRGAAAHFPLKGRDLLSLAEGPALGRLLARLEDAFIASDFTLDRDALMARAHSLAEEGKAK